MNPGGGKFSSGHNHGDMEMQSHEHSGHTALKVDGNCEMCKERIEKAALSVSGVSFANQEAETKKLHLNYSNGVSLVDIHHAVAQACRDTESERAPDSVYDELPGYCVYQRLSY